MVSCFSWSNKTCIFVLLSNSVATKSDFAVATLKPEPAVSAQADLGGTGIRSAAAGTELDETSGGRSGLNEVIRLNVECSRS
jgi:hypothetical protein